MMNTRAPVVYAYEHNGTLVHVYEHKGGRCVQMILVPLGSSTRGPMNSETKINIPFIMVRR